MEEKFRKVIGYENSYEVSLLGNINSLKYGKKKNIKARESKYGYSRVNLYNEGKCTTILVHKIVAMAFLNHNPNKNKLVINHINFKRNDNRVSNLELVTIRYNTNQKQIKSTSIYPGTCWHKASNKWSSQIYSNGKTKYLGVFKNELDARDAYQKELTSINKL